jgi:ankyrin repeat protein
MIVLLCALSANPNEPSHTGAVPLHAAARCDSAVAVFELLFLSPDRITHLPHRAGHTDAVQALLQCGANALIADSAGRTAAHEAATGGHLATMQALLGYAD